MTHRTTAVLVAAAACLLSACGTSSTPAAKSAASTATADVKAPTVIPLTITFAEEKTGLKIDAVDIGKYIVDGVDHERGIIDRGNWKIAAQCDNLVNGKIKVGVIKSEESDAISAAKQGSAIAENTFKSALDCPAG